jgi:hypothetical protein
LRVPFSFVVGLPPLVVQHFLESRGFPRAVIELSVRDYFLDVAQEVWEELMVPVSGSFSPGPVEYFALLVRTSLSVLHGLSRTVQALFKESVCDGLPMGTTVTMFLRQCVAADMVDYVVQSHGSSGCVVRRTDGKVTRDFPAYGLVVPGAVVLVRLVVTARSGALGVPAASVFASTVPLPPAAGVFPVGYMSSVSSLPSAVSVPVVPGPSDWLASHMQVALQLDDRAERNKNKKKHHTRQVSDVLRYDRVWLCSADPEKAKHLVIMEVVNRVSEIMPAQISMPTAWSLLETIAGVDVDRFVPLIGVSTDVEATKMARKFASDLLESKGEEVIRTLFVATPKCVFSVLYCVFCVS